MADIKAFYNGSETVAALDEQDADLAYEQAVGEKCEFHDGEGWTERPLDAFATITFDSQYDMEKAMPDGAEIVEKYENGGGKVRATWKMWADKTGRGLICSEEW